MGENNRNWKNQTKFRLLIKLPVSTISILQRDFRVMDFVSVLSLEKSYVNWSPEARVHLIYRPLVLTFRLIKNVGNSSENKTWLKTGRIGGGKYVKEQTELHL